MRSISRSLVLLLLAAAAAAPAPAQESSFSESFDVQAINVQVVVTDKKGGRVPGLTAKDFRILQDGQPVAVDFFLEVRDNKVVDQPKTSEEALPSGIGQIASGEEVGNSYLIFIDEVFSPIFLRNEALRAMAQQVKGLSAQDRVAVVTFDGTRLHILTEWAAPGDELASLLESAGRSRASIAAALLDQPSALPLLSVYDNLYETSSESAAHMGNVQQKVARNTVAAATAALRTLAPSATGRKIMVLLSGGWQVNQYALGTLYRERIWQVGLGKQNPEAYHDDFEVVRPLTDNGNLLGYTIYPIFLASTASWAMPSSADRTSRYAGGISNRDYQYARWAENQSALLFTAQQTGGKLLPPGREPLPKIEDDTKSYYWLGFTHSSADNKRRDLKVEVLQPGLEVRARTNFLPLSREAKTSIEVESALLTGRDIENARPLEAAVGKLTKKGLIAAEAPLRIKIPLDQIAMVSQEAKYLARLELRITSLDENGGRVQDMPVIPIELEANQAASDRGYLVYETTLKLRKIDQELLISLYDALGGGHLMTRVKIER